jgi:hypothetical protein
MPASIRIIKIVKDKNPVTLEEEEAYTAEIECEAEDAKNLAIELASCPYGKEIMDLLRRANFIPVENVLSPEEIKAIAEAEEKQRIEFEEMIKKKAEDDLLEKIAEFLVAKKKYKDVFDAKKAIRKYLNNEATDEEDSSITGVEGLT